jgi:hypothetical protein
MYLMALTEAINSTLIYMTAIFPDEILGVADYPTIVNLLSSNLK